MLLFLVFMSSVSFSNYFNQASAAHLLRAEKLEIASSNREIKEQWEHTRNGRFAQIGWAAQGAHHKNPGRRLNTGRVTTWQDIEGVLGQYTDLPYPAYLPQHWAEERKYHLNCTVCSK